MADLTVPQSEATFVLVPRMVASELQIAAWGISFASFAQYSMSKRWAEDSWLSRCYVTFIMILTTVATALIAAAAVLDAVVQNRDVGWFSEASQGNIKAAWITITLAVGILTRAFLAKRAYSYTATSSLTAARLFVVVIIFFTAGEVFGFSSGFTKLAIDIAQLPPALAQSHPSWLKLHAFAIGLSSAAASDVAISGVLAWRWIKLLREHSGFSKRTDTLLKKLISFTLATASYTAVFAITGAILWGVVPGTYWLIFVAPFSGLYTLSLFTTLNLRAHLQSRDSQMGGQTLHPLFQGWHTSSGGAVGPTVDVRPHVSGSHSDSTFGVDEKHPGFLELGIPKPEIDYHPDVELGRPDDGRR